MNVIQFQADMTKLMAQALASDTKPGEVIAILEIAKLDLYIHLRANVNKEVKVHHEQIVPIHRIVPKPGS